MSGFKITGPGEYRTRDGRKAVVISNGCIPPEGDYWRWFALYPNGDCVMVNSDGYCPPGYWHDAIIAPWEEPNPTPTRADILEMVEDIAANGCKRRTVANVLRAIIARLPDEQKG